MTPTQETASTFYAANTLLAVAEKYLAYVNDAKGVSQGIKYDMNQLRNHINRFIAQSAFRSDRASDVAEWKRQFTEREYQSFGSVLMLMVEMSDEQRMIIENFAEQLSIGQAKLESRSEPE